MNPTGYVCWTYRRQGITLDAEGEDREVAVLISHAWFDEIELPEPNE